MIHDSDGYDESGRLYLEEAFLERVLVMYEGPVSADSVECARLYRETLVQECVWEVCKTPVSAGLIEPDWSI